MESLSKKEILAQLAERFPNAAKFELSYYGSGDSFDSFHSFDVQDVNERNIPEYEKDESDFLNITENYIFDIFERSGNPNFNDDGSEGTITFDMINKVVTLHNYWIVKDTQSTGEELF